MGYWLPDNRLEMPELFHPRRKPVGEVEIDWKHKSNLQDKLIGFFLFDRIEGGIRNVTGGRGLTRQYYGGGGQDLEPSILVDPEHGRVARMKDRVYGSSKELTDEDLFTDDWEFTTAVLYKLHTYESNGGASVAMGDSSSGGTTQWVIKDYSNEVNFYMSTSTGDVVCDDSNNAAPLNEWVFRLATSNRVTGETVLHTKGMPAISSGFTRIGSPFNFAASTAPNGGFRFGIGDANAGTGVRSFDGELALGAVWNKFFTKEMAEAFFANPYQFLRPKL